MTQKHAKATCSLIASSDIYTTHVSPTLHVTTEHIENHALSRSLPNRVGNPFLLFVAPYPRQAVSRPVYWSVFVNSRRKKKRLAPRTQRHCGVRVEPERGCSQYVLFERAPAPELISTATTLSDTRAAINSSRGGLSARSLANRISCFDCRVYARFISRPPVSTPQPAAVPRWIRVARGISSVTEILHGRIHGSGYIYTGIDENYELTSPGTHHHPTGSRTAVAAAPPSASPAARHRRYRGVRPQD